MYSGSVIDDLMEVVVHAEEQALLVAELTLRKSVRDGSGSSTHIYEPIVIQKMAVA